MQLMIKVSGGRPRISVNGLVKNINNTIAFLDDYKSEAFRDERKVACAFLMNTDNRTEEGGYKDTDWVVLGK